MLVLRKEMKMGLGIGAAVLGIAAVYGLMATLSSSSNPHTQPDTVATSTDTDTPHGLDSAVTGLPPKDDGTKDAGKDGTLAVAPKPPAGDPFAESNRTDGKNSDPWTLALATGKVNAGGKPVADNGAPLVVQTPTTPLVSTTPGDDSGAMGSAGGSGSVPNVFTDPATADPSVKSLTKAHTTDSTTPTPGGKYIVAAGDTLSTIAAKEYGSKRFYLLIAKANPNVDPRRMRVGTELTIPAKDGAANVRGAVEPAEPTLARPIDTSRQYRVAPGDTLHGIALKLYGKSGMWESIYDANKAVIGPDAGKLKIGVLLTLPKPATHTA